MSGGRGDGGGVKGDTAAKLATEVWVNASAFVSVPTKIDHFGPRLFLTLALKVVKANDQEHAHSEKQRLHKRSNQPLCLTLSGAEMEFAQQS